MRDQIAWSLSSFFVGEERVTTQFSGLVMAYETSTRRRSSPPSRSTRRATPSTSTASTSRSLQLDGSFEDRLERCRERRSTTPSSSSSTATSSRPAGALIDDPRDIEAKVDFVTIYHMVIEGTLALTGQYFQTDYMRAARILPGLLEGFKPISQDEHRHVAYGTWFLQQKAARPGARAAHPGQARGDAARPRPACWSRPATTLGERLRVPRALLARR